MTDLTRARDHPSAWPKGRWCSAPVGPEGTFARELSNGTGRPARLQSHQGPHSKTRRAL